jgi:hypothetical protein
VNTTEQIAKPAPMPSEGLFAPCSSVLRVEGTGAPTSVTRRLLVLALLALATVLPGLAFTAAPALAAAPEAPEALKPEPIKPTEATLRGIVNPKAAVFPVEPGTYQFLYKATKTDMKAECESVGASKAPASPGMYFGLGPEPESEPVTGLTEGTEYIVCLAATNARSETTVGPPFPFQTRLTLETPVNAKVKAGSITATTVEVEGELNPGKEHKTEQEYFEILYKVSSLSAPPTGECEESATHYQSTSGVKEEKISEILTGLEPSAKYTFCLRVDGHEDGETATGAPVTFNTLAAPPTIDSESVSNVKSSEATLEGSVNPNNQLTECHFEYGTTKVSENEVPCSPEQLKGFGEQNVSPMHSEVERGQLVTVPTPITGLTPNTTYKYRILTKNGKGEEATKENTFTTAFPPEAPAKPATPKPAVTAIAATTAELHGVLNPTVSHESEPGTYEFVYRRSATECQRENPTTHQRETEFATPAGTATGLAPEPVEAEATGLLPGTTYTFCLLARNNAGETAIGSPETFTTLVIAPVVEPESESTTEVTADSATLHAQVQPNSTETTFRFEYIDQASYEAALAGDAEEKANPYAKGVSSPAQLLAAGAVSAAEAHIEGLQANTLYHYRVVVTNSAHEMNDGADATFTTQTAASGLPDGREWEMVSPADMHGALVQPIEGEDVIQAAADGDAFTYLTDSPTEGQPPGYSNLVQVFSARGPGGWQSRDVALPVAQATGLSVGEGQEYWFFSEDLSHAEVQPIGPYIPSSSPLALAPIEASEQTGFIRTLFEGGQVTSPCLESCYRPLVTGAPGFANVPEGTIFGYGREGPGASSCIVSFCGPQLVGATPDLSHVVLKSYAGLTSAGVGGALYEWSGGQLAPVSVLPAGEGGELSGSVEFVARRAARDAISRDGSRVVWRSGSGTPLYVRENVLAPPSQVNGNGECVEPSKACTISLDEGLAGGEEAVYQAASENTKIVFFTEKGAVYSPSYEKFDDLYEYDLETGKRTLVTKSPYGALPVLGVSADGSTLYFVSSEVLDNGGTPVAGAVAGEPNLYVRRDGVVRLVAVLSSEDVADWGHEGTLIEQTTQVSASGEWLAFMSQRSLTGYDNRDAVSGQPDEEVFLYNASTGKLICASCDPTGARPHGVEYANMGSGEETGSLAGGYAVWNKSTWIAANVPGWTGHGKTEALYQSRYLLEDGRLFFNSSDALVPQDVDGTEDLYEWEPPGVGGCSVGGTGFSERSGGCIGLISAGTSSGESAFLDASQSGSDVFFIANAGLAGPTSETTSEVYDAHECTAAAPCAPGPAPQPPTCTTAEACRAAPTPQPSIYALPPSATFSGPGDSAPSVSGGQKITKKTVKCRRGDVRNRKGKCVPEKKKHTKAKKSAHTNRRAK